MNPRTVGGGRILESGHQGLISLPMTFIGNAIALSYFLVALLVATLYLYSDALLPLYFAARSLARAAGVIAPRLAPLGVSLLRALLQVASLLERADRDLRRLRRGHTLGPELAHQACKDWRGCSYVDLRHCIDLDGFPTQRFVGLTRAKLTKEPRELIAFIRPHT